MTKVGSAPNQVPLTPLSFLNRCAEIFPDSVAAIEPGGYAETYSELHSMAARLADGLRASGVGRGDCVAVLAPNGLPLLAAHFGVPGAEAVLVALNTRLASEEYAYILNHARARVLLVDRRLTAAIDPIREQLETVKVIVELGEDGPSQPGQLGYQEWVTAAPSGRGLVAPSSEDAAISVNYTSGTTGRPKGVVYTHRGAYLNALGVAISFALTRDSVYLWTLPMFHCNGWCFPWAVTAVGGQHVCLPRIDSGEVLRLIAAHGVTHFCAAPVVLNGLVNHPAAEVTTFAHPVKAATGGAPPSPSTIARVEAMGIQLTHLYGLTETYGPSLLCEPQAYWSSLAPDQLAMRVARQGVRTVNVEAVRVVDEDMNSVPPDGRTTGEVVVRSNTVMAGYLRDEQATAEAFAGGWFHTGDVAVVHEDGYLEVRDRSKDVIISGGENISSVEVENVLMSHPAVLEVAVVACPDQKWGEVPVAVVTLKDRAAATETELIDHVRARLAHFKAPKQVVFAPLPKTSTGKIQKTVLRERL